MTTPFSKDRYDVADFRNALADIKSDIETIQSLPEKTEVDSTLTEIKREIDRMQPVIARSEMSTSATDEMRMLMDLSGLEIKMTNFANDPKVKDITALSDLRTKMLNFADDLRRKLV